MKLFEIAEVKMRARPMVSRGFDDLEYETPFPIEYLVDKLELLYPMIKNRLQKAPIEQVKLDSLTAVQSRVHKDTVTKYKKSSTEPILVARINGKNYIMDGTHRAAAAWAMRKKEIDARFLEYKDLEVDQQNKSHTSEEWINILDQSQVPK
jgi:hypothetical protein